MPDVCGYRASRPATHQIHTAAALCCRPVGEQARREKLVLVSPGFRPGGSGLSDPAPPDRDRGIGGSSRSDPSVWRSASRNTARSVRFLSEPDCQTTPLAQAGVILRPVRHSVPLLRNTVTAGSIELEWHNRMFSEVKQASTLPSRGYQLAHPCNKAL